eukprot:533061_1
MATSNSLISLERIENDLNFLEDGIKVHLFKTSDESKKLKSEYAKFMYIKFYVQDFQHQHISPSAAVDQIWHLHLLYCTRYIQFCHKFSKGNQIIDHSPDKDGGEAVRLKNTLTNYSKLFGMTPPHHIWDNSYYTSSSTMIPPHSAQPPMATGSNKNVQKQTNKRTKSKVPKCKNGHKMTLLLKVN